MVHIPSSYRGTTIYLAIIGVISSVSSNVLLFTNKKIMYFDEIVDPLDKGLTKNLRTVIYGSMTLVIIFFLAPGTLCLPLQMRQNH